MASRPTRKRLTEARLYTSGCPSQKVAYASRGEALDAAESLMQLDMVKPGCHITPFLCEDCHRWHVFNRRIYFAPASD